MIPVAAGNDKIKVGETLWFNLTTHTIGAKLGSETLTIKPSSRLISKPPLAKNGYYKTKFFYRAKGKKDFQPIMNKSWWHDANSRNIGFVVNRGRRLPRIFTFKDQRVPKVKEEPEEPQNAQIVE